MLYLWPWGLNQAAALYRAGDRLPEMRQVTNFNQQG